MDSRLLTVALLTIATASIEPVMAQTETAVTAPSAKTREFVQKASAGNQFEIESSQLALKRATQPEVKGFAEMMVADHAKAGDDLEETIAAAKINLTPSKKLDKKHQKMLDTLKSSSAANFDNAYIKTQTDVHDEAIDLFREYIASGDNSDIREFATDTLPTLEKHQETIHNLKMTSASNSHTASHTD